MDVAFKLGLDFISVLSKLDEHLRRIGLGRGGLGIESEPYRFCIQAEKEFTNDWI